MSDPAFSKLETNDCYCFLCGVESEEITAEHVFPKWLQTKFDLWNKKLDLLNGTTILYKSLKIPCCSSCNNEELAHLEKRVALSVASGYEACSCLDAHLWYLWVGKLFYGILRKEIKLKRDRTTASSDPIIPSKTLKFFSSLHVFLQGILGSHEFVNRPPYSVLICNLHDLGPGRNFGFRDSFPYMTVAIRMGSVGVIVALEDGGVNSDSFGRYVTKVNGRKLHPIQFDELYAKVTYQAHLIDNPVKYISSKNNLDGAKVSTEVFGGLYIRDWSQKDFSELLKLHIGDWLPEGGQNTTWFSEPNLVPTWMVDHSGELLLQPLEAWERSE
ncbi:hypothetical protein QC589_08050 [Halomonas elongata]|uniref:hypothetical protein n=1 Tax=Halomonas elongata TaxID=2746 RepID=UPI00334A55D0